MKCMNRNVLYSLGAVAVAVFFFAPSARHYLPLIASLACPLSMAGMMFGASKLGKNKTPSCATTNTSSATRNIELDKVGAGDVELCDVELRDVELCDVELRGSLRDANLADLRARIAELEKTEPKTRA